jgi:hypothetical protein
MEHRHSTVELGVDRWFARSGKIYFAKFAHITRWMFMLMLSNGWFNKERAA